MSTALDLTQQSVVDSTAARRLVVANPGAGKTRTAIAAIQRAIANGIPAARIVAFTFTNAGAKEMADRLSGVRLGYLGTIHGYCFRLLQRYGERVGYRQGGINMLNEEQSFELLKKAAAHFKYKGSDKALEEARDPAAQLCHKHHQFEMKRNNLVDYDGVLREAASLLREFQEYQRPCLLVLDEAQDSAEIDWEIAELINPEGLLIVGDPDQSIFGFRGAYPQGFLDAWRTMIGAECFTLETNYRSLPEICTAAERLIQHNTQRVHKPVTPYRSFEGQMTVKSYLTGEEETRMIARRIQETMRAGDPADRIAVLCRTNYLCEQFRKEFQFAGIPVQTRASVTLPPDFGHAMNVLSMFADPRSDIIAERVISRSHPEKLEAAKKVAAAEGKWLSMAAFDVGSLSIIASDCSVSRVTMALSMSGISRETTDLICDRIRQLPQPEPTLADLRHDLFQAKEWVRPEGEANGVTVTTVHSAKGREWPIVYLPAWEDGIIPSKRQDTDIEEERRLAFVAITRAADACHISYAAERAQEWGPAKRNVPSRFIQEAGL